MKRFFCFGSSSLLVAAVACSNPPPTPTDNGVGGSSGQSNGGSAGAAARAGSGGGTATGGGGAGGTFAGAGTTGSGAAAGSTASGGTGGSGASGAPAGGSAGTLPGGSGGAGGALGGSAGTGTAGGPASGGAGAGASGAAGSAGTGAAGASSFNCGSLPLCDDFETGSTPNTNVWTTIPNGASGATIDSIGAHGSGHSLKVVSSDRLYLRNSTVIGTLGSVAYVHFYVRFATTLASGHGAMVVTHPTAVDQYSQSNELRFGSQDSVFHWNTDSDAANVPDVSPDGDAASFKPAANTWYCINLTIDTKGPLDVSIDGADQPGLTVDGTPTMNIDQAWLGSSASLMRYTALADFNVGWDSYGAGALTLWYDDVALSSTPIACP
ncbi:MAG TPA: hypothetical protein VMI54_26300 [Polyangiaceae bacterium]|nr:hypothetical protein [Polyangiaceae bacterium]